jgi:L-arabinose transport system ATP-binding protein
LFQIVRQLQRENHVILYVTHRMEEVYEVCDSGTVLRDGRHVKTWESMAGVTPEMIINQMVGRDIANIYNYSPRAHGPSALRVERLFGPGVKEPVSLEVKSGEIVGLFGLVGAGRTELLKLIYGATRAQTGKISIRGANISIDKPADAIRAGLVFCPEDRKKEGIIPIRSVMENLNISARRNTAKMGFVINNAWEQKNAEDYIRRLGVKTPSPQQLIMNLSGGNQQKVILARWLSEKVNVILFDEPTRGIDVGAKSEIYNIIYSLARQGVGVLVVSSDLPEVLGICDRVIVMRQGRIAGELLRAQATSAGVMKLALPISN